MDRIAVAGLSIHDSDVAGLERLRRPSDDKGLREIADALGASELVFLATCNRVEVIYAREEGEPPGEADLSDLARHLAPEDSGDDSADLAGRLRLRTGRDAVRHLFRVTSSLDSLVVGEDQILAQVRAAYGRASDIGLVGPLLSPLFHHALAIGKRVRTETDLARHPVSVVTLAVSELTRHVGEVPSQVAVLGAGEMGSLLARVLGEAGLPPNLIVNRTLERARLLADDCGATAVTLEEFTAGRHPVDVLVSATTAPGCVVDAALLEGLSRATPSGRPLIAIDLAVPRDVAAAPNDRVVVIDLDDLRAEAARSRALRAEAAGVAEQLVDAKVDTFSRRLGEQAVAPTVSDLHAIGHDILESELTGLLNGRFAHLEDGDRRALERWARSTYKRLMHHPISALKRLANDQANDQGNDHISDEAAPRAPAEDLR